MSRFRLRHSDSSREWWVIEGCGLMPTPPRQGVACRRPSVALKVRHPSSSFPRAPSLQPLFAVTDRGCFLELGVRRLCLLSRASVAVCLPFSFASSFICRLCSRSSPFTFAWRSPFALIAVHRSGSRSFGSHVALLQTLRPTRALHPAVELLSFVAAVSSLNPPPDSTLTQHQFSASNSATSDFYYNKAQPPSSSTHHHHFPSSSPSVRWPPQNHRRLPPSSSSPFFFIIFFSVLRPHHHIHHPSSSNRRTTLTGHHL
ncbi:hypothetical protein Ahy_A09g043471 [Arachis hypogaea]|uniref:Uncharacterized protein n=1 Tax=Arachis hypogaea TaxID=3818 RepID=A0A445BID1_ARAHY|nr:hypothetical protein Ahy_A09g043471 [Arachis hypogaea]